MGWFFFLENFSGVSDTSKCLSNNNNNLYGLATLWWISTLFIHYDTKMQLLFNWTTPQSSSNIKSCSVWHGLCIFEDNYFPCSVDETYVSANMHQIIHPRCGIFPQDLHRSLQITDMILTKSVSQSIILPGMQRFKLSSFVSKNELMF